MTGFVRDAIDSIAAAYPEARAGVLQFSNDVRVEMAPQALDSDAFAAHLSSMVRVSPPACLVAIYVPPALLHFELAAET